MIEITINNLKFQFEDIAHIYSFLQKEKKSFELFWYLEDKKTLVKEDGFSFGNNIKSIIFDNYEFLLTNIYNNDFDTKIISKYFQENKLIYTKSIFYQELEKVKNSSMRKLAIYMIGIFTQNIQYEKSINLEIEELAKIRIHNFKKENISYPPYKVLVIDGGGILGYYEAALLSALDKYFTNSESDLGKSFNMICGTSTGAILATGLAKGIPLSKIKSLYRENAKDIFPNPTPDKKISLIWWFIKHFSKPSASQETLKKLLNNTFKNITLKEIWEDRNIALCIPSLLVNTHTPYVFKTPHDNKVIDQDLKLKDICLASAAAPIFFPLAKIKEDNYYTDGGLWANNPILIGLTEALKMAKENQPIEIYSLTPPINNESTLAFIQKKKQGIAHWKVGINIVNMSLFSQSKGYTNLAHSLSKSFKELGKSVKIIQFMQGNPGKDYLDKFGLDKNSKETFLAMDSLIKSIVNVDELSKIDTDDIQKLFD